MSQTVWMNCKSPPYKCFVKLLSINNTEFIIVPYSNDVKESADGVYKYNSKNNEWIKVIDYDKEFVSTNHSAIFDKKTELIYVINQQSQLLQMDLNNNTIKILSINADFGAFPKLFHVNDCIHFIRQIGVDSIHYIFDKEAKHFEELHHFNHCLMGFDSLYIKSKKQILTTSLKIIGGELKSSILEYSASNNKWSDWHNDKTPNNIYGANMVSTKNDEYLIFISGIDSISDEWTDCISFYDTKTNEFKQSSIKTPVKGQFAAAITRDDDDDNLLTFGFINKLYKSSEMSDIQLLPFYLIQFISNWICYEQIHLISICNHWKIDVDKIIQEIE